MSYYVYVCVCLTVLHFLANVAIVCYCCFLSTLLLFDSCKEVETFHFSPLWTLTALPVAILVGTRDPSTNFGHGGGEVIREGGLTLEKSLDIGPVPTVKENLLSQA